MKKWLLSLALAAVVFYFTLYNPPLPAVGTTGKIGRKFTGLWDGTTASLTVPVTDQTDTNNIFNHYPEVKTIVDSTGVTYQRT